MSRLAAIGALLVIASLAGCAARDARAPYVGEITDRIVDGRPLVRFPAIEVIGYRRSAATTE